MMSTATRPALLPLMPRFRFRVEICAVVTPAGVSIVARDVVDALNLPIATYNDEPSHACTFAEHGTATTWNRDTVVSILEVIKDRPDVAEFLTWFDARIADLTTWGLDTMHDAIAAPPAPQPEDPSWFSVAEAARILAGDPTISIGQVALFEWLHSRGWIDKTREPQTSWTPKRELLQLGYLTVLDNRIPGRHGTYPQICITAAGMRALHERLGGSAALNLHPTPNTPLLED